MGLFDRFKKKSDITNETGSEAQRLENSPELLTVKLLFKAKPNLDTEKIWAEAKVYFDNITQPPEGDGLIFTFPDFLIDLADAKIPAQCLIAAPDNKYNGIEIPEVALQQNWHWPGANEAARKCKYELIVTDFMSRSLEYKKRLNLFMNFLVAVIKATNPELIYSVHGQKLIKPSDLIDIWDSKEKELLYVICNVRLYNISDSVNSEILMDTVGLNSIGLPDIQIRFSNIAENAIAQLLWNYAYYIYEHGDVVKTGNTLEGVISGSKWKCERQVSPLQPERIIINIKPD